jgi:hypothetical protein
MIKEQTTIKKDTSQNWAKAKNFIPKNKEIIIYTDLEPNGTKIGDGKTKVNDLPFIDNTEYYIEDDMLVININGGDDIIGRPFQT